MLTPEEKFTTNDVMGLLRHIKDQFEFDEWVEHPLTPSYVENYLNSERLTRTSTDKSEL